MDLSVVIPSYREAEALALLLPVLEPEIAALAPESEILIVDSMEPLDDTQQVCERIGGRVRHLRRRGGNYYGDAVKTGISEAKGERILFMDADGSHNPRQLALLWNARQGRDIVIGSRYVAGGATENPAILILLSWIVNISYRVVFGLKCHDVSNSLRLYRSGVLKPLTLQCRDFDIVEEILIKICHHFGSQSVVEVPITFEKRKRGESKRDLVKFAFSYLQTMIRLFRLRNQ